MRGKGYGKIVSAILVCLIIHSGLVMSATNGIDRRAGRYLDLIKQGFALVAGNNSMWMPAIDQMCESLMMFFTMKSILSNKDTIDSINVVVMHVINSVQESADEAWGRKQTDLLTGEAVKEFVEKVPDKLSQKLASSNDDIPKFITAFCNRYVRNVVSTVVPFSRNIENLVPFMSMLSIGHAYMVLSRILGMFNQGGHFIDSQTISLIFSDFAKPLDHILNFLDTYVPHQNIDMALMFLRSLKDSRDQKEEDSKYEL